MRPATNKATLTLRQWGNSLAVRIPASIARAAGFKAGLPVAVTAQDSAIVVVAAGERRLSLAEKLALFDPELHGGEAMPAGRVGKEAL